MSLSLWHFDDKELPGYGVWGHLGFFILCIKTKVMKTKQVREDKRVAQGDPAHDTLWQETPVQPLVCTLER